MWATVVIDIEGVQSVERGIDARGGGASSVRLAAARLVLSRCGGLVRLTARPEGIRMLVDLPEDSPAGGEDPSP
jgi:hypothetical protein